MKKIELMGLGKQKVAERGHYRLAMERQPQPFRVGHVDQQAPGSLEYLVFLEIQVHLAVQGLLEDLVILDYLEFLENLVFLEILIRRPDQVDQGHRGLQENQVHQVFLVFLQVQVPRVDQQPLGLR